MFGSIICRKAATGGKRPLLSNLVICRKNKMLSGLALLCTFMILSGCGDKDENSPIAPVDITLDPNSTIYQGLNIPGGWLYLNESDGVIYPSRGIIVYRLTMDQFLAFERTPPYKPDSCCSTSGTNCTRLIVEDDTFVVDTCTNSTFLLIDGSPFEGPARRNLWQYVAEYDGYLLYVHD